jgi:hypothetical protein
MPVGRLLSHVLRDVMMVMVVVVMMVASGESRHGCAQQHNSGQQGDPGFLQAFLRRAPMRVLTVF